MQREAERLLTAGQEEARAYALLEEAARKGDRHARAWAAHCCLKGLGRPQDTALARLWCAAAEEPDVAEALIGDWQDGLPQPVRASLAALRAQTDTPPAGPELQWLEPGQLYPIPGTDFALRCEKVVREGEYEKRLLLVLPGGRGEQLLGMSPRQFYACWGEAPWFAIIDSPASRENELYVYRLEDGVARQVWHSPQDVPGRVQWELVRWEGGRLDVGFRGEDTGRAYVTLTLPLPWQERLEQGRAQLREAVGLLRGTSDAAAHARAYSLLVDAAQNGSREARAWAGCCCLLGRGTPQHSGLAELWMEEAADNEAPWRAGVYNWTQGLPGLVRSLRRLGLVPHEENGLHLLADEEIEYLEPGRSLTLPGLSVQLRFDGSADAELERRSGKKGRLALVQAGVEHELVSGEGEYEVYQGTAPYLALRHDPVLGQSRTSLFLPDAGGAAPQRAYITPEDAPGQRRQWWLAGWAAEAMLFYVHEEGLGGSFRTAPRPAVPAF